MRLPLALAVLLALALSSSGCLDGDGGDAQDGAPGGDDGALAVAPEPLHWQADVLAGADPFNLIPVVTPVGGGTPCSTAASSCYIYDFSVNATVDLVATLAWGLPANDFDLYLYQGDSQLSQDGINSIPPGAGVPPTNQVLHQSALTAGDYAFWVVAWNSVGDGFTLDVDFTLA